MLKAAKFSPTVSRGLLLMFRWHILMPIQCGILLLATNRPVLGLGAAVALSGIWVELLHRLLSRIKWGYVDTSIRLADRRRLWVEGLDIREIAIPSRLQMVRDFVLLFAKLVCAVVLSYWAVFVALTRLAEAPPFSGLQVGASPLPDLLYFSLVTLATVGYGDIAPRTGMARAIVGSEILAGFSLLVLLLTAFSLTADTEEPPDHRR